MYLEPTSNINLFKSTTCFYSQIEYVGRVYKYLMNNKSRSETNYFVHKLVSLVTNTWIKLGCRTLDEH